MQPSYYAVIPATVRYDKNIPPNAKLLYGEITALSNAEGYCYAGNSYFAELYGVDKDTVSGWLSKLVKANHVRVDWNAKANERKIFVTEPLRQKTDTSTKKVVEVYEKSSTGVGEKSDTSTTKDRHNIIYNNTDNIISVAPTGVDAEKIEVVGIGEITSKNIALYVSDVPDKIRVQFLKENAGRQFPHVTELAKAMRSMRDSKKEKSSKMTPPTLEEVKAYMESKKMPIYEADRFWNHHEARGWILSGNKPMQKWKAAVATWMNSSYRQPAPKPEPVRTPEVNTSSYQDLLKPEYKFY